MRKYITIPFEDYSRMKNHNNQSGTILSKLTKDNDAATAAVTAVDVDDSAAAVGSTESAVRHRQNSLAPSLVAEPHVTNELDGPVDDDGVVVVDRDRGGRRRPSPSPSPSLHQTRNPPEYQLQSQLSLQQQQQQQQHQKKMMIHPQKLSTTTDSPLPPQLTPSRTELVSDERPHLKSLRRQWMRPTAATESDASDVAFLGGRISDGDEEDADRRRRSIDELPRRVKVSSDRGTPVVGSDSGNSSANESPPLPWASCMAVEDLPKGISSSSPS